MSELRRSARVASNKRGSPADEPASHQTKKSKTTSVAPNGEKKVDKIAEAKMEDAEPEMKEENAEPKMKPRSSPSESKSKELIEGDEIPDLTLQNQDGGEISLKKLAEENRIIIIFAYPKASTPGCTRQACGFRDNYEDLKEHAAVFGLSTDNPKSQKNFQTKQKLPFGLLCDPKRLLIGSLGAKKTPQAGTIRSHWIFVDGKLKSKNIKVSPEFSVEEGKKQILELAKELE